MCFDFLYNFYLKGFSFYEEFCDILSYMYTTLHVKCCPLFPTYFRKTLNIFKENRPRASRVVPYGRTNMTLTVAFCHLATALQNSPQNNDQNCLMPNSNTFNRPSLLLGSIQPQVQSSAYPYNKTEPLFTYQRFLRVRLTPARFATGVQKPSTPAVFHLLRDVLRTFCQ